MKLTKLEKILLGTTFTSLAIAGVSSVTGTVELINGNSSALYLAEKIAIASETLGFTTAMGFFYSTYKNRKINYQ